ncbi:MAG: hypothetical protein ACKVON_04320 [Beijerinckiaceae bacterium]
MKWILAAFGKFKPRIKFRFKAELEASIGNHDPEPAKLSHTQRRGLQHTVDAIELETIAKEATKHVKVLGRPPIQRG